jgi:hypothetical protein
MGFVVIIPRGSGIDATADPTPDVAVPSRPI